MKSYIYLLFHEAKVILVMVDDDIIQMVEFLSPQQV